MKLNVYAFAESKSSDVQHLIYLPTKTNTHKIIGQNHLSSVFQRKYFL